MKITVMGIFDPNIGHSYQPAHGPRCWSAWGKIEESRPSDWPCHFRTTRHWPADQPVRQFSLQRACLARTELEAEHQGLDVPPKLKADLIETVVEQMREDGFEDDFENGRLSDDQLRDIAAEACIALVDLAGHPA